eukprot:1837241-Rhodomonas_salina.1
MLLMVILMLMLTMIDRLEIDVKSDVGDVGGPGGVQWHQLARVQFEVRWEVSLTRRSLVVAMLLLLLLMP